MKLQILCVLLSLNYLVALNNFTDVELYLTFKFKICLFLHFTSPQFHNLTNFELEIPENFYYV